MSEQISRAYLKAFRFWFISNFFEPLEETFISCFTDEEFKIACIRVLLFEISGPILACLFFLNLALKSLSVFKTRCSEVFCWLNISLVSRGLWKNTLVCLPLKITFKRFLRKDPASQESLKINLTQWSCLSGAFPQKTSTGIIILFTASESFASSCNSLGFLLLGFCHGKSLLAPFSWKKFFLFFFGEE